MTSSKSEDKRRRIVEAATSLFNRYGFKRTSVDLLATEAGVAKPTIYAYFEDKDAIFRAVVESVCAELLEATEEASRARISTEKRLTRMLSAKFTRYFELVNASPHAQELMDSQNRLGGDVVAQLDRAYLALLAQVIAQTDELDPGRVGLDARSTAQLLLRAASGASYDATSAEKHREHLAELVRVIVAALRTA